MSPEVILKFDGGYLRALKPADVHDGYVAGLNDPVVNRFLELRHSKQTNESVGKFVSNDQLSPASVLWGVWADAHPDHVGTVRIHGVEYWHRTAHIGVCLFDRNFWGRGLGKKSIMAATSWAHHDLGMHWIEAGVYEDNISSVKTFTSAGYDFVFDIPNKYFIDGSLTTVKVFAARQEVNHK